MTKRILRSIAFLLLISLSLTPIAMATDTASSRASEYLSSYVAYMVRNGNGNVSVRFEVTGTEKMDDIGALTVKLQESKDGGDTYTTIKTFSYLNYSYMLKHNTMTCVSSVSYDGVAGRYYQAIVTVYAAKGNGSDSRTIYASPIKAS